MTIAQPSVDLTNCDKEPIHILGRVQSHGLLFVLREHDLVVLQLSANADQLIGRPAAAIVGQPLANLLDADHMQALHASVANDAIDNNPLYVWTVSFAGVDTAFDGILHRYNGVLILEFEPVEKTLEARHDMARLVRNAVARLQQAQGFAAFCQAAAEEVRALTGFDRVMMYQFDPDGHGSVIAEARTPEVDSFLGLHYPASDIPKQARALYVLNWLRLIADVNDTPATLVPPLNPTTNVPLDMSFAVLRSVSPIHIEYLQNMGVGASMSISLVQNGQLWGLIACHHYAARIVPFETRAACEFLAQAVSLQLEAKQRLEQVAYNEQLMAMVPRFVTRMSAADSWQQGIATGEPTLLDFIHCGGCAITGMSQSILFGKTPPETAVQALAGWLAHEQPHTDVFATDRLGATYPPFAAHRAVASGLLALPIVPDAHEYILWFRPEEEQEVHWAGEPTKPVELTDQGLRLSPRKSFELWKETIRGRSLAWQAFELEAARALRNVVVNTVVRRAEELARLNRELERSNAELDAFAFIASHDLREPLRGIHSYAHFLIEDYGDTIDPAGHTYIDTITRLAKRMDVLLESLLQYSRVGRLNLAMADVDLNVVLADVLETVRLALDEQGVAIRIPRPLPTVRADRVRLAEVFANLIVNAAKYNDKAEKWIEIGWKNVDELSAAERPDANVALYGPVIYVRDNGIGIPERQHGAIFRIFRRLHGRDEYGGGSGAGLTIAKKIVERHNGHLWLASAVGQGTTFYLTLRGE